MITRNAGIPVSQIVQIFQGNTENRGSWGHKKIAIAFATWCSPEFFAVVIDWADEILTKGGYVSPDASNDQLEALKAQIEEQQAKLDKVMFHAKKLMAYSVKEFFAKGAPHYAATTKEIKAIDRILWDYRELEYRDGNYKGYSIPDLMEATLKYYQKTGKGGSVNYRILKLAYAPFMEGETTYGQR